MHWHKHIDIFSGILTHCRGNGFQATNPSRGNYHERNFQTTWKYHPRISHGTSPCLEGMGYHLLDCIQYLLIRHQLLAKASHVGKEKTCPTLQGGWGAQMGFNWQRHIHIVHIIDTPKRKLSKLDEETLRHTEKAHKPSLCLPCALRCCQPSAKQHIVPSHPSATRNHVPLVVCGCCIWCHQMTKTCQNQLDQVYIYGLTHRLPHWTVTLLA